MEEKIVTDGNNVVPFAEPVFQTAESIVRMDNVTAGAAEIVEAWNKSVEAFINTGLVLLKWKKVLGGSGKWMALFDKNIGNVPFGIDTAERLMRIARNKVLTNSANWQKLPPSIRTLDELSKVSSSKKWEAWFKDGTVTADTELKTAKKLVGGTSKKKTVPVADTQETTTDNVIETESGTDDTDAGTTASNTAKTVLLEAYDAFYKLACIKGSDWSCITQEMYDDLIKEMNARLVETAEQEARNKRIRDNN
jgi:hypothetical protein